MNEYTIEWYMMGYNGVETVMADIEHEAKQKVWNIVERYKGKLYPLRSAIVKEIFYNYD